MHCYVAQIPLKLHQRHNCQLRRESLSGDESRAPIVALPRFGCPQKRNDSSHLRVDSVCISSCRRIDAASVRELHAASFENITLACTRCDVTASWDASFTISEPNRATPIADLIIGTLGAEGAGEQVRIERPRRRAYKNRTTCLSTVLCTR